jgi:Uma2 family endonuclease
VVQPDVFVVCDPAKVGEDYIKGAPDFVIEVLSDSTKRKDVLLKYNQYQNAGVKEYWMLDVEARVLTIAKPEADGYFKSTPAAAAGRVPIGVLNGVFIDFDRVFPDAPVAGA